MTSENYEVHCLPLPDELKAMGVKGVIADEADGQRVLRAYADGDIEIDHPLMRAELALWDFGADLVLRRKRA